MDDELTVATWNVLAAPWAAPGFYAPTMDPTVLDRTTRSHLVAQVLRSIDADVVCLQETTPPDLAMVLDQLGGEYDSVQTSNDADLWSNWSTPEIPWEPNGTAVVWRPEAVDVVETGPLALGDDGNVATWLRARHHGTGLEIRVLSVHLDADAPENRRAEFPIALGWVEAAVEMVDVVAGDCNEDTVNTDLGVMLTESGFVDCLSALHRFEPTHPLACPSDDYAPLARLDHLLVRGATPSHGLVVDSGVWDIGDAGARLEEHLRRTGSDHLPAVVTLALA